MLDVIFARAGLEGEEVGDDRREKDMNRGKGQPPYRMTAMLICCIYLSQVREKKRFEAQNLVRGLRSTEGRGGANHRLCDPPLEVSVY